MNLSTLKKCRRRKVPTADSWYQNGLNAEKRGDTEKAIVFYLRALELNPHHSWVLNNLGAIHYGIRKWAEAEKYYLTAIAADPTYALAYYNLGNLYEEHGVERYQEAFLCYKKAIESDSSYKDAYYNLALMYYVRGQWKDATCCWRKYLELDPNSEWSDLARTYYRNSMFFVFFFQKKAPH